MDVELTLLSGAGWRGEEITGSRLRGLLALLADDLPAGCGAGRLIDELWPDETPEHPAKALQTLVSRARARLGTGVIESTPAGYRLTLAPEQVDSSVVLRRAQEAGQRLRAGDPGAALTAAEQGLALFQGGEGPLRAARTATRAALTRVRALALARLGRAAEAIEPLTVLAGDDPRDEEVLLELLRCEAPAKALIRYDSYRRALRDELGVDPGPALTALHRELLHQDAPLVREGLRHEPNELLGRDGDIAAVTALLRTSKVVSIVGAGGLGKTRLAQAVGRQARQRRVHFVELAGVTGDVATEVASHLGGSGVNGIAEALGDGLLVLDNCEHVIDEVAALVRDLVGRGPALRVLTTSRAPLQLTSEAVYPLPELDLPTSVELFRQRARAARPVDVPAGAAEAICRHLDGLPLALELAAARMRTMSAPEIAKRLADRFELLRGGHRDHPERHRTLQAVIEWSWHLLEPAAQRALRALAIFPGGFDAGAARFFTDDAVVAQLVDQSLLKVAETAAGTRFRMLETVREFGAARLDEAGETAAAEHRFLAWAQERGRRPVAIGEVDAVRADEDNLVRALRLGVDRADAPTVAAAASQLGALWLTESQLTRLIAMASEVPPVLTRFRPEPGLVEATRAAAVWCALIAMLVRGPAPVHALAVLRRLPPPGPDTVVGAAQLALEARDEKALRDLAAGEHPLVAAVAHYGRSYLAEYSNDLGPALAAARAMLTRLDSGELWLRALAHSRIGELCLLVEPGEEAYRHIAEALSIAERFGAWSTVARARWALTLADLQRGAFDQAERGLDTLAGGTRVEDAGPKMIDICTRAGIRLGRGDVDGGLAAWRAAAAGLGDDRDLWSAEVRAVAVLAHHRHGRLDLVADIAETLPSTLAGLLPQAPPAVFRICGVLLVALAAVTPASAIELLALAEGFGFSCTFGEPARFAEHARASHPRAYAEARAQRAGLDHEGLRAAALDLLSARDPAVGPLSARDPAVGPLSAGDRAVGPLSASDPAVSPLSARDPAGTAAAPTDSRPRPAPDTIPPR